MSGRSGISHSSKMDVEYVPTLATDPQAEKTRLEPPRDVSRDLTEAREQIIDKDAPDMSVSRIINPAPKGIEPTKPSLEDSELSSVDLNDGGDDWIDVDSDKVPSVGKDAKEAGWESVDLASAVAKCNLTGEDEYAIESFRSSKKKEDLLSKLGDEIEWVKEKVKYNEKIAKHKKVASLRERIQTIVAVRDELEAKMEE